MLNGFDYILVGWPCLMPPTEELSLCLGVSDEIEVTTIATDEATIAVVFSIKCENVSQCNDGKETC